MNGKLVIVTDLGRLKAYRFELTPQQTPRLELIEELCFDEAHGRLDNWVTDVAGRRGGGQTGTGTPLIDANNLKLENERRIIRQISIHIEALIQRNDPEVIWLAAQKEINPRILEELPHGIRAQIEMNLPCDLVGAHPPAVLDAFFTHQGAESSTPKQ